MGQPKDPASPAEPYSDWAGIPVPDAREDNSDTAWSLFQKLDSAPPDTGYAPTTPASLPMPLPPGDPRYARTVPGALTRPDRPAAPAPASARLVTLAEAMALVRRNNRICPQPQAWQKLYEMLPGKRQVARGWEPPAPLTGSAWSATPSIAKRMCLRDHIEWAEHKGCLDEVYDYLKGLPDTDWHHL